MKIKIDPMTEDLRRQRRNLIAVSFVLCFMKYGGIVITKTTLFGTEIRFANISAIYLALWLIWIYFCIRYYQYFMQEGVMKIRLSLSGILTEKCRGKIKSIVSATYPTVQGSSQMFDYNILKRINWYSIRFTGHTNTKANAYGDFESENVEMDIPIWLLWKEILKSYYTLFLNQSVMTDYVFPVLFAAFTFIYCNLENWDGKILNLI